MKKTYTKKIALALVATLMAGLLTACGRNTSTSSNSSVTKEVGRTYNCDYKTMSWNTEIATIIDGKEVIISGNFFTFLTDPLIVKDSDGNILGHAGDAYGVIEQDDHGIYIGDTFDVNMCGNFDIWGESYQIKNEEGEVVAEASFGETNTSGTIVDTDGNLVAEYSSSYFANDYKVVIYDNNVCSDMSILMIIASYVSDYMADN